VAKRRDRRSLASIQLLRGVRVGAAIAFEYRGAERAAAWKCSN